MNNWIINKISKLFVAAYVLFGYAKYFFKNMRSIKLKNMSIGILLMVVAASLFVSMKTSDVALNGNSFLNEGYDHFNNDRFKEAHNSFQDAYDIFVEAKSERGEFVSLRSLGDTDVSMKNNEEALKHFDNALLIAQRLNYEQGQIDLLIKHAKLKIKLNRIDAARAHFYDAIKIAQDLKSSKNQSTLFTYVGNL